MLSLKPLEARYKASVFCVSLPGVQISLVICVRGYTYHGGTHITATPALFCRGKTYIFFAFSSQFMKILGFYPADFESVLLHQLIKEENGFEFRTYRPFKPKQVRSP